MSEPEELRGVATYIFTWQALSDACKRCASLNGREYQGQNIYQEVLWDPIWGNIWNLNTDHSLAHGIQQYNCRCQLAVRVECDWNKSKWFQDLKESIQTLHNGGVKISNIPEAKDELGQLRDEIIQTQREILLYRNTVSRAISEARGMGLPPIIDAQVAHIQRLIRILNSLIATYRALKIARLAAGDPIAYAQLGIEAVGVVVDIATEVSSH